MWTIKQQCTSLQMPCSTKSYGAASCFFNESDLNIVMAKTRAVPLKLLRIDRQQIGKWVAKFIVRNWYCLLVWQPRASYKRLKKFVPNSLLVFQIANYVVYSHWNTGPHMTILLIIWLEDSTQLHFMNSTLYGYTDHIIWSLRTSNIHYWRTKYIITAWINERQCILVALWLFKRSSSHIQTVGMLFLKSVFLTEEYTAHFNIWFSLTIGNLL